jgi:hypothetical protein
MGDYRQRSLLHGSTNCTWWTHCLVVSWDDVERNDWWFEGADSRARSAIEACYRTVNGVCDGLGEIKKEFHTYKQRVFVEGRNASPAKVDDAIVTAADHNRMMKELSLGPLSAALRRNEEF